MGTSQDIGFGIVLIVGGLFLAFLPVLVAAARTRTPLAVASFLLSVLALGGLGFGSTGSSLGFLAFLPVAGTLWFCGLVCGIAAYLDAAAERRNNELMFRLLNDDARNIDTPSALIAAEEEARNRRSAAPSPPRRSG